MPVLPPGFKDVDRLVLEGLGDEDPRLFAAQPLVLEEAEDRQVGEALDPLARVEVELLLEVQPEGTSRLV
jgi:hypothetical protein